MPRANDTNVIEKQRVRAEIASQIEEFLRKGGRIEVLEKNSEKSANSIGNVWHTNDDLTDLSD
jgi:hypothetical protein